MLGTGPDGTALRLTDVTDHDHGADFDLSSLDVIASAPAWLTTAERLILFTLIYSLRPKRYLEIGILYGGASLIVSRAMDTIGSGGRLILVDAKPQVSDEDWQASGVKLKTSNF